MFYYFYIKHELLFIKKKSFDCFYTIESKYHYIFQIQQILDAFITSISNETLFFRLNSDNIISILDSYFKNGDNTTNTCQYEKRKIGLLLLILYFGYITLFSN